MRHMPHARENDELRPWHSRLKRIRMDARRDGGVAVPGDDDRWHSELAIARGLPGNECLEARDLLGIGQELLRTQAKPAGGAVNIIRRCWKREEYGLNGHPYHEPARRQREGMREERTNKRCRSQFVIPGRAADPRMRHRRQQHKPGHILRMIECIGGSHSAAP